MTNTTPTRKPQPALIVKTNVNLVMAGVSLRIATLNGKRAAFLP